ncbi:MAG: hypothetical protein JNJ84_05605 [Rhodobacteraceae bacterium]|jgi:hypothetical protein|uniref:hypothetical protein n=1 Tax=Tabrizicola sp. SY72 TaxID=2741673 RepID=UPI00157235FA|nr:hypothetical protein [Tabrizicola sp. SY72]MBL9055737.1 hypothetical protein [Paracoccaceae bacterium]NTT84670.1 hypothetical protein [Tabrizicola sp. SY72]
MDTDLILVIGMLLSVLAIPSLLAAYSESRAPRTGAIMLLIGGVLIVVALTRHPSGYTFAQLPDVVAGVVGRLLK